MKEKLKKGWHAIKSRILQLFKSKKEIDYPIEIPISGVKNDQLIVKPETGSIIIDSEEQVIIEEYNCYRPSKTYNSFGFNRSIFLPNGVEVEKVVMKIHPDKVLIGWYKQEETDV